MSTKELAYSLIDRLDEKQLDALVVILQGMSGAGNTEGPNSETIEALNEVEDMKRHPEKYKGYDDVDEMFN